jgi:2-furoyl-CoA dehydrogenase 2Fe-2S iron sulfur subunit
MPRLSANARHTVRFTLNGRAVAADAPPRMLLTDFLRHDLGMTGVHVGCEHGVCGACTIEIDGAPARACLTLAVQIHGASLRTVEALAPAPGRLSILQEAFRRHHALQCGFCTPGILMSFAGLREESPTAGLEEVEEVLTGHLCRCTGYRNIVRAAGQVFGFEADGLASAHNQEMAGIAASAGGHPDAPEAQQ